MKLLHIKLIALFLGFGIVFSSQSMQRPVILVAGKNNTLIINGKPVLDTLRRSHSEPSFTSCQQTTPRVEGQEQDQPAEQDHMPPVQEAYAAQRAPSPVAEKCVCIVQ